MLLIQRGQSIITNNILFRKKRKIDADKSLELRQQFLSPRQNARRFQSSFF